MAKIENANSVRPFGDDSIHAIKYFAQVPKRAAIGQPFHHGQPGQKLSSNFRMPFGPFLDPASSHDPHSAQNVILFLFVQANLVNDKGRLSVPVSSLQVTRDQFGAIAENRDPRNHERLTVRTKDDRRAGYDFTFSVPKSVFLYVAMSGDRQVERMIMESFRETMTLIENAMQTRVRGKGRDGVERDCDRCTSNMMYAAFVHRETRPVEGISDPHFHVHAFVFNATWDQEETRWKAVQFGNTKTDAPFYEAGFHSLLASKLLEAGYAIRRTERDFERACVSRQLIEKFSKRTFYVSMSRARARCIRSQTLKPHSKKRWCVPASGFRLMNSFPQAAMAATWWPSLPEAAERRLSKQKDELRKIVPGQLLFSALLP